MVNDSSGSVTLDEQVRVSLLYTVVLGVIVVPLTTGSVFSTTTFAEEVDPSP